MDNEIMGPYNSYNAEFWQYDPRVGRRWNVDPIAKPHESPYAAFANNPILFVDVNGADTSKPSMLSTLDNVVLAGAGKSQQKIQMLEAGIKNQVEQIGTNRSLKEKAFADMMNSKPGTDEFKADVNSFNEYLAKEQTHTAAFGFLIGELYKAQKHDDNIKKYNEFVNNYLDFVAVGASAAGTVASFIPTGGTSSGFFMSSAQVRASLFSAKGGYGLFGKSGLRIGGYKIEAMYMTPRVGYGTGTIFSIKQIGRQGGNLLRWDYGILHGTQKLGLHSSFRLNVLGKGFGGTGQYSWYAPFKFWKYPR